MLDVDRFKQLNDTYGHVAGDRALVSVADALREQSKTTDIVGRWRRRIRGRLLRRYRGRRPRDGRTPAAGNRQPRGR